MANKNSNWPAANQPDIKPEKMAQQIQAMETLRELPQINYADCQEVEERIKYFFNFCVENELRPTVELMALSVGVSRQALWQWEQEGSARGKVISSAKQTLGALMEQWGVCGKINPTTMIFLLKNHHGYKDEISIEPVQHTNSLAALPDKSEILRRLPQKTEILPRIGNQSENEPDLSELLKELGDE